MPDRRVRFSCGRFVPLYDDRWGKAWSDFPIDWLPHTKGRRGMESYDARHAGDSFPARRKPGTYIYRAPAPARGFGSNRDRSCSGRWTRHQLRADASQSPPKEKPNSRSFADQWEADPKVLLP